MTVEDLRRKTYGSRIEYDHPTGARFIFDQITSQTYGLYAWVELRWTGPPPRLLHASTYNLMGSRTVSSLSREAEGSMPKKTPDIPWRELLTAVTYDIVRDHLEGEPPVRLTEVAPSTNSHVIKPFALANTISSLAAPGGTGKSFMSMAIALTVATGRAGFLGIQPEVSGPVMYLDWEADASEHARRMHRLTRGAGIMPGDTPIFHHDMRRYGPLHRHITGVANRIAHEGCVFAIIDSVTMARAGDLNSSEATIALFGAINQLGISTLLIDHKSREAMRRKWRGAIGSVVNDNSVRRLWEVTDYDDTPTGKNIYLEATKNNIGRWPEPLGFEIVHDDDADSTRFRPIPFRRPEPQRHRDDPPQHQQLRELLEDAGLEGMTMPDLAEALGVTRDTVRARLNRELRNEVLTIGDRRVLKSLYDTLPDPA